MRAARDFIQSGRRDPALDELDLATQAALSFVRSRVKGVSSAERARLLAAASADDLLQGSVAEAMRRWK